MEVKCATSFDERFDPKNVLDNRNINTFWITTGLYPQELLLQFDQPKLISEVRFQTSGGKYKLKINTSKFIFLFYTAKKIVIEGCKQANAGTFNKIGESKDLN